MSKYLVSLILLASLSPACTADDAPIGPEQRDDSKSDGRTTPLGIYRYDVSVSGEPESGDILWLELVPSGEFQAEISDELSGTATDRGIYRLTTSNDGRTRFIDLHGNAQSHRFEYEIDELDGQTLWLRPSGGSRFYALTHLGDSCITGGCNEGNTCQSCFGEDECMPASTSC